MAEIAAHAGTRVPLDAGLVPCPACGRPCFWAQTDDGQHKVLLDGELRCVGIKMADSGQPDINPVNAYAFVQRMPGAYALHGPVCERRAAERAKGAPKKGRGPKR